ncbi:sensor histidine kinase [Paraflavitalea sp. CAU 1676]|uniref:tetratricopeptide repeat-containing sensor histidine kinase n=1 Tax=Paraflavitalea sp. CAU 1676 TaxID=3032598 RepID=UPI0023D9FDE6|nr:sensor histidine kinase [Paraflavitalea sp. CAU 1676]MDF2190333.1 sensor histidine kinase [Paraflavitalea sp. CAU 1676]
MPIRKYALAALLVFAFSGLFSQDKKADLQQLIAQSNDTAGINALMNYGVELINFDNPKAKEVFNITLEKSARIGYDFGMGSSYARLGYLVGHEGRNQEGIDYAQKAVAHFERINRTRGIILCYINMGYNFDMLGLGDSAIHYFLKGIQVLEKSKTEPGKLARLYENVGTGYANRREYAKALSYSRKAVELATSLNDSDYIVTAHTGLSYILNQSKDYKGALEAAQKAKRFLPHQEDPMLIIKAYSHLAAAWAKVNEPDSAIAAAKKSMLYSAKIDPANYIAAGLELADAYELKKDIRSQKNILDTLKQRAEADTSFFHLFSIYDRIAQLNFSTGNYKEAYAYRTKYFAYKDSFYSRQNTRTIAEVESRFQWAQKEKALSEKQLQLTQKDLALEKSNRNVFYALAGLVVMLLIAAVFYIQSSNRKKAFALKLDALHKQQEIDMLEALMQGEEKERSRIAKDLHDGIAGMLAAAKMHLGSIVRKEQGVEQSAHYRQTVKLLDEATGEVRKTSHNLMPEVLLQHGLDEALRRYCGNVSSSTLTFQYDSWGDIERYNSHFELSVYRIVQELINNIIKHAQASEAIVQVNLRDAVLSITVQDNGVGFAKADSNTNGMGLQSLAARTKAMQGKMEIESDPGAGVSVYLEFETGAVAKQPAQEQRA